MKTYLYNFDPLEPHFYTVKLGFTGIYIIFLISAQNIDCRYSLDHLSKAVLMSTHNLCFEQKYEQEAHGPQFAHLSDKATADMQMFPIIYAKIQP